MSIDKLNELLGQIKPEIGRYVAMAPEVGRIINSCPRARVLMSLGKDESTFPEPATDPWEEQG